MYDRRITGLILLLFVCTAAHATVYRWTGPDGTPHFGQTPPPGVQAHRFNPDAPPPPGNTNAQKALQSYVNHVQSQQAEQKKKTSERNRRNERAQARAHNCELAKRQRQQLRQGNGHRFLEVGADGKTHRLTENERQQKLTQLAKRIQQYCGSTANGEH